MSFMKNLIDYYDDENKDAYIGHGKPIEDIDTWLMMQEPYFLSAEIEESMEKEVSARKITEKFLEDNPPSKNPSNWTLDDILKYLNMPPYNNGEQKMLVTDNYENETRVKY